MRGTRSTEGSKNKKGRAVSWGRERVGGGGGGNGLEGGGGEGGGS